MHTYVYFIAQIICAAALQHFLCVCISLKSNEPALSIAKRLSKSVQFNISPTSSRRESPLARNNVRLLMMYANNFAIFFVSNRWIFFDIVHSVAIAVRIGDALAVVQMPSQGKLAWQTGAALFSVG
ncbi:hypothetical protein T02_16229 [Trichinella nativa]|uniref:Uncharacterized protein n=1 Tax=Trichinella nativa TaxID=6335 RepID=A0A0V1L8V9_9BILA|nr:hypothetical protein T02_16229 [Trichinella nativa]